MSAPEQAGGGGSSSSSSGESSRQAEPDVVQRWEEMRAGAARVNLAAARRRLKLRNALTALAIGAVVVGIYGYSFYSISQEHFLDDLEVEAKALQAQAAKTSSN